MNIPVFLINLKKRKNRRDSSLNFLNKLNLDDFIILKKAVSGEESKKIKYKFIDNTIEDNIVSPKSTDIIPTWNCLGCCISHYECWKQIIRMGMKNAIIVEDDNIITNLENAKFSLNKALNILKHKGSKPWFISLASTSNMKQSVHGGWNIPLDKFYSTSFYLLNIECANLMVNKVDIYGFKFQLDLQIGYWGRCTINNKDEGMNIYYHNNSGIIQDTKLGSDVQIKYYTKYELYQLLPLPMEVTDIIYKYLVIFYKEQKELIKLNGAYYENRAI